ncbi:putative acetyltransferase domain protein [Mycobacterium xenopi 4042]|uniref:Putative acetyltransferase domain protein n=1 Tax=Mycobacterium xenopi 4042 TaxID=1299334 RepID=X7YNQ2_MYCXE|nr:putative acetyltransferase domain protein [Mycobacterium xenopi 4042]
MLTLSANRPAAALQPAAAASRDRKSAFYRHDLDGLRGIAIALVAMFHVWFGRVSGGVDVFLALSGFFFGGKVLRTALNPVASLSPAPEVIRLVRRLLPALVVVLAGSAVLTILIQPQTRWETFADQSLASLGYYQNWELARTAGDYLRAGKPSARCSTSGRCRCRASSTSRFWRWRSVARTRYADPSARGCGRCSSCCSAH